MYSGRVIDSRGTFLPGQCVDDSYGNYITIRYTDLGGNTIDIKYAHLNKVDVHNGDIISVGQYIGKSGNTGNAGGIGIVPHLHVEIRENGTRVDPAPYFATNFSDEGSVIVPCDNSLN